MPLGRLWQNNLRIIGVATYLRIIGTTPRNNHCDNSIVGKIQSGVAFHVKPLVATLNNHSLGILDTKYTSPDYLQNGGNTTVM